MISDIEVPGVEVEAGLASKVSWFSAGQASQSMSAATPTTEEPGQSTPPNRSRSSNCSIVMSIILTTLLEVSEGV